MRRQIVFAVGVILLAATFAEGSIQLSYTGILGTSDVSGTDGLITGADGWSSATTFSWTVSWWEDDFGKQISPWTYTYSFVAPVKSISHLILEVSDGAAASDFFNVVFTRGTFTPPIAVGTYNGTQPGNPGMPGELYGAKFDETEAEGNPLTLTFSFDSWRQPVWGDFYAKDGDEGGVTAVAWNEGFTRPDPTVSAHSGSEDDHILRPDSAVPEPASLVVWSVLGVVGVLAWRRRKAA